VELRDSVPKTLRVRLLGDGLVGEQTDVRTNSTQHELEESPRLRGFALYAHAAETCTSGSIPHRYARTFLHTYTYPPLVCVNEVRFFVVVENG